MKKLLLFIIIIHVHRLASGQQNYWQQEVRYRIDVSLDDKSHSLEGFLKLQYTNHSPDTLTYIWFHVWPNAFKNDRTAFSEQTLENGRTDFYFSHQQQRGYINRLDFRTGNTTLHTEDHPQYIDVIKVLLAKPLAPGEQVDISTPFHVQLPYNFSRGGHTGQSYQVTQWYPKPAVYDRKGWHPMPYLDQGEFYSEFGSYDVRITVPKNYVVAATGELQNAEEKEWLKGRKEPIAKTITPKRATKKTTTSLKPVPNIIKSDVQLKTLQYLQSQVHDFAWFADKYYGVKYDTIQLPSGRTVEAWCFYNSAKTWKSSLQYIKDAVHFRSAVIGEYPYHVVSVVEARMGFSGGMEYPTITSISGAGTETELDMTIEHEVGHNWFYGILATNERDHPWMDEGMNSYYDKRYKALKYPVADSVTWIGKRIPADLGLLGVDILAKEKRDQPIALPSAEFTYINYGLTVYEKTAAWMQLLEQYIGAAQFDSCMKRYYREWQFKHPYPEDFQQLIQQNAQKDVSAFFSQLQQKGSLTQYTGAKKIKPVFLFSFKDYQKTTYLNWVPVPGYNKYDQFMLGLAVSNYNLPAHNFQFFAIPLYATNSKQLNGMGGMGYTWYPGSRLQKITIGWSGSRFSSRSGVDSNGNKVFGRFYKVAPSVRFTFKNSSARSTIEKWLEWRTFFIGEQGFNYFRKKSDNLFYPDEGETETRYLNQLTYNVTNYRALYPYDVQAQLQQGKGFYRATLTGNYFFNYTQYGGMQVRFFAAKFGFIGERTSAKEAEVELYQPKLTAVRGYDDYTYSNYFFGRNEFEGFASQQMMLRDGGLKLRTDMFSDPPVYTDNWMAAMNFSTTLPKNILPVKLPVKLFLDVGTMAEYWQKGYNHSRFLYVGGLQLSLFKDLLNFYAPLVYSKEFKDNLKTVPEDNTFFKKLSFSIDIHRFNLRKITEGKFIF